MGPLVEPGLFFRRLQQRILEKWIPEVFMQPYGTKNKCADWR